LISTASQLSKYGSEIAPKLCQADTFDVMTVEENTADLALQPLDGYRK